MTGPSPSPPIPPGQPSQPGQPSLWRQPAGVYLVAATEFWERFSFYGLTAMLVLFLSAPATAGGLGWSRDHALSAYGLFGGFAFALPALGGWLTDRFLGEHRSVIVGGCGILLGNAALFAAGLFGGEARTAAAMAGLGLVVLGTGLLKPAISTLVGRIYDARRQLSRENGFTLFLMGIWLGSIAGTIFSGAFGEVIGWRWGFGVSACGMAIGLIAYIVGAQKLMLAREVARPSPIDRHLTAAPAMARTQLAAILAMTLFTAVYAIAFYQKAGVLMLMLTDRFDRHIGQAVVPAALFLSISTAGFVVLAPLFRAFEAKRTRPFDVFLKQALGLAALAAGYLLFLAGLGHAAPERPASGLWMVAGYLFFAVGDVLIWPPQIATISRIAPPQLTGLMIGIWYVTVGVGNLVAGLLGPLAGRIGYRPYLIGIEAMLLVAIAALLALRIALPRLALAVAEPRETPL